MTDPIGSTGRALLGKKVCDTIDELVRRRGRPPSLVAWDEKKGTAWISFYPNTSDETPEEYKIHIDAMGNVEERKCPTSLKNVVSFLQQL